MIGKCLPGFAGVCWDRHFMLNTSSSSAEKPSETEPLWCVFLQQGLVNHCGDHLRVIKFFS